MGQHGNPADGVQYLRQIGFHPLSLARREDDRPESLLPPRRGFAFPLMPFSSSFSLSPALLALSVMVFFPLRIVGDDATGGNLSDSAGKRQPIYLSTRPSDLFDSRPFFRYVWATP